MHPHRNEFAASIARSALKADPYDPQDYPWTDMPWLECTPLLDLSADILSVENQLQFGSCVSNSLTSGLEQLKKSLKGQPDQLSRMYHYYRGRDVSPETAPPKDGGMTLKQGLQAAKSWGVCKEVTWPYDAGHLNMTPSNSADIEAAGHRLTLYRRIKGDRYQDIDLSIRRVKESLTLGYPVQVGFVVEESFFDLVGPCNGRPYNYAGMAKLGAVEAGGHAVLIVGYCQRGALDYFKIANSWGTTWGDDGYALLPMVTLMGSDSFDIWSLQGFDGYTQQAASMQQAHTFISRLYVGLFGRAPDAEGLAYWSNLYLNGRELGLIAGDMFATDPARAYYPSFFTNAEIAASFYLNVLGRQADPGGLAYWTQQLNVGQPGPVIQSMISTVATYAGTDDAGIASCDLFNRRVRAARLYAENGGAVEGSQQVITSIN